MTFNFRRLAVRYLPVWIIMFSLILYYLFGLFKPVVVPLQKTVPAVIVHTQTLQKGRQKRNLLLYGKVQSTQQSTLSARVNTVVDAIYVRDGDQVKKGQLLVQLSQMGVKLDVRQAKAYFQDRQAELKLKQLSLASQKKSLLNQKDVLQINARQLKRLETLSHQQYVSADALDKQRSAEKNQSLKLEQAQREVEILQQQIKQAQSAVISAEAKWQDAKNRLTYTKVVAPFNGVVTQMHAAKGEHVNVGVPLLEVMSLDDIELRALIPTSELFELNRVPHEDIHATVSWQNQVYPLKLARLSGQVQTGQIGVEAIFSAKEGRHHLKRGRVMLVTLSLPRVNGSYSIPLSALYGNNKVYIVRKDRLVRQDVKVVGHYYHSVHSADLVVLGDRLKDGDQLLINQIPSAINGLKVKMDS